MNPDRWAGSLVLRAVANSVGAHIREPEGGHANASGPGSHVEGGRPVNRRGNGLSAESYDSMIDLAPHLADAVLVALREAGVAAYAIPRAELADAEPSGGTALDDESLDRLFVDSLMRQAAEDILRGHLTRLREAGGRPAERPEADAEPVAGSGPGSPIAEHDEEAIWAAIVASYDTEPEPGQASWPEQENLRDEPGERAHEPDDDDTGADTTGRLPMARMIKSARPEPPEASDDEHYVPPPPPPLPRADPITKGAWLALIGGPAYLLLMVILGRSVSGGAAFLAVAAFIGGFVTLVLRMGDDPRDPDDGAVV